MSVPKCPYSEERDVRCSSRAVTLTGVNLFFSLEAKQLNELLYRAPRPFFMSSSPHRR